MLSVLYDRFEALVPPGAEPQPASKSSTCGFRLLLGAPRTRLRFQLCGSTFAPRPELLGLVFHIGPRAYDLSALLSESFTLVVEREVRDTMCDISATLTAGLEQGEQTQITLDAIDIAVLSPHRPLVPPHAESEPVIETIR